MKRARGTDLQTHKRHTQGEVHTSCGGVLPNIELDDSKREALVYSTKIVVNF